MKGIAIYNGRFALSHRRLKDVMITDSKTNPLLWFVKDLGTMDMIVCGVPLKRDAVAYIVEAIKESSDDGRV